MEYHRSNLVIHSPMIKKVLELVKPQFYSTKSTESVLDADVASALGNLNEIVNPDAKTDTYLGTILEQDRGFYLNCTDDTRLRLTIAECPPSEKGLRQQWELGHTTSGELKLVINYKNTFPISVASRAMFSLVPMSWLVVGEYKFVLGSLKRGKNGEQTVKLRTMINGDEYILNITAGLLSMFTVI